jgi:hypothetical protein
MWAGMASASVSGISLTKKIDPRDAGMGNASTAAADDAYSIFTNPAGLSYLNQSQLATAFATGLTDDTLGELIYADAHSNINTWAIGFLNYNLGNFDYVDFNGDSTRMSSQDDWIVDLSYAWRPASPFRMGVNFKVFHSEILDRLKATTIALDLGTSVEPVEGLRLDAVVKNLGLPITYSDDSKDALGLPFAGAGVWESLPLSAEAGLSYSVFNGLGSYQGHDLLVAANAITALEKPWLFNVGMEYCYLKTVAVRAGYSFGDNLDGLSLGAGVKYPVFNNMPMELDYAVQLSKALNYQHTVALSLGFDPNPERTNGAQVLQIINTYRPSRLKIGWGAGGSFGGPGASIEWMVNDYIGIFGGLGVPGLIDPDYGVGAATGVRFYFGSPEGGLRGRFSQYAAGMGSAYGWAGLASTMGLEWRFIENLGLNLDIGAATDGTYVIPMGDIGLVMHICGDKKEQTEVKLPSREENVSPGQNIPLVEILTADSTANSATAAIAQEPLPKKTKTKIRDFSSEAEVIPKLGLGFGMPYGLLGANVELMLGQTVGVYGGLGTLVVAPDMGYQFGMRVYLLPMECPFRFRLGLGYGTAAIFLWQEQSSNVILHYEVASGVQPSVGFEWRLSRIFSLDFDVIYQMLDKHDATYRYAGQNFPLHLDDGFKAAFGICFQFPGKPKSE